MAFHLLSHLYCALCICIQTSTINRNTCSALNNSILLASTKQLLKIFLLETYEISFLYEIYGEQKIIFTLSFQIFG